MKCYSKRCINFVTLFISIIVFIQVNFLTYMIFNMVNKNIKLEEISSSKVEIKQLEEKSEWKLYIPKINLEGEIKEGTSEEIINNYIGHFEATPMLQGNVGIIAGSSGYKENYFKDLEKIQEGDVIIYYYQDQKYEYKVILNTIIEQTDWSYLSSTNEEKLTLITGILEQPEKRRCVQAIRI